MRFQIEHRIGVQTPPAEVWRHLADLPSWPEWNPMYPQVSGRLQIGGVLKLSEAVPGEKPEQIAPVVIDWVPDAQILWSVSLWGGLLRRTRYLEIQKLDEGACVFSNGELYQGLAARFMSRRLRRAMRQGFAALGEALKLRAEAQWAAQAGAGAGAGAGA